MDSVRISGTVTELTSPTSYFDSAFADGVLLLGDSATYVTADFYTDTAGVLSAATVISGESLWFHYECFNSGSNWPINIAHLTIYDSSGFPWLRLLTRSVGNIGVDYNSGTGASPVWTNVGGTFAISASVRFAIDLKLTLGSPHTFEVSYDGSLGASGSFTQALFTNAANARLAPKTNGQSGLVSQLMATRDISTIGAKVKYIRATGNGANTAWTGVFSDVNEAIGSDTNINAAPTVALVETHAMGDVTLGAGFEIKSVFHWLRAKNDGSSPTNIKSVLRASAVDYSTGNLSGMGFSYAAVGARYNTNPATLANWTQADWNAIEAGYESAA